MLPWRIYSIHVMGRPLLLHMKKGKPNTIPQPMTCMKISMNRSRLLDTCFIECKDSAKNRVSERRENLFALPSVRFLLKSSEEFSCSHEKVLPRCLFVTYGLDGIQIGGTFGRIPAEEDTGNRTYGKG